MVARGRLLRWHVAVIALMLALAALLPSAALAEAGTSAPLGEPNAATTQPGTPDPAGGLLAAQAEPGTRQAFLDVVNAQPSGWYGDSNKYNYYNGQAWCAYFVRWCAGEAGVSTGVLPEIYGCTSLRTWFDARGRYHWGRDYAPRPGDLVLYDWYPEGDPDIDADHVGVVVRAYDGGFVVKEGNTGGGYVQEYNVSSRENTYRWNHIDGFCIPDFPEDPTPAPEPDFNFGPNVTLPAGDGTYTICSTLNKGLFLDGGGGFVDDGANVMLWPGDGDEPQRRWDFTRNDDGTYTIWRHGTNKVLDVNGISGEDGANVQIWESSGTDNQRWYVQDCGNGTYALKAKHSGKFLDATDAAPYAGTNVQQWHGWATDAMSHQKFIISRSFGPAASLPAGDGTYTICSTLNKGLFLDGGGGSVEDGANAMLWPGDGDEPQRRWDFRRNDDGTYSIFRHGTNKALGVYESNIDNGANVNIWEDAGHECRRFWLEDCGNGVYALKAKHSGKFLDATDAAPQNGANIQQWHGWATDATSHQKFIISPSYGPSASLPEGDGTYTICSMQNKGLFLDGGGGSAEDGANAMLWPGDGDEPQRRWDFRRNDDGTYSIFRHGTNKVLGVYWSSADDGDNVNIWEDKGSENRRFWLEDCGNGVYALKAKHSGKFLDVDNSAAPHDGTNVQQWHGWSAEAPVNQRFIISPSYGPCVSLPKGGGPDGITYAMATVLNPEAYVGAAGDGTANGDNGELMKGANRPQCRWDFRKNEDGTYTVYRSGTSKVLGVSGITSDDGANVHLWEIVGGDNQRWWLEDCGGGAYALKSKNSGKFMDLSGGVAEPGTNVHQWRGNFGQAQRFRIEPWANDLAEAEVSPIEPQPWLGVAAEPRPEVRLGGVVLAEGVDYELSWQGNAWPGTATVTATGIGDYAGSVSVEFEVVGYERDGWVDLPGGRKGYARGGMLVTGWMDLGGSKYWFQPDGAMSTGWTDVEVGGKTMHYYFNPASGNLVRGTWFQIDGRTYYFRPSGNLATGWATISDNGVDKKYYLDDDGQLVTGWRDIDNGQGQVNHYYFRPSGSMATGWATIDGQKYWFRPSGNMATGFATVDDAYKRYFDAEGHMLTGWQDIGGKRYYFRASGAMQTGEAVIDGKRYVFSDKGVLVDGPLAAQSDDGEALMAQANREANEVAVGLPTAEPGDTLIDLVDRSINNWAVRTPSRASSRRARLEVRPVLLRRSRRESASGGSHVPPSYLWNAPLDAGESATIGGTD